MKADDQTILSLHTRVITHNPRIFVAHDDSLKTWQLKIRQLKESDRGCYMCQINTSQMKKQLGCIDVQIPPDIDDSGTSSDVTMSEGENVTLSCTAMGHPEPRILWRREDGKHITLHVSPQETQKVDTYMGSVLNLFHIDRFQMGPYLCIASNDVPPAVSKRVTLFINFAPIIHVAKPLVGSPQSFNVKLKCEVESFPPSHNYWMKERDEMLLEGNKYTIENKNAGNKNIMTLTIHDVTYEDYATYACIASNIKGKADGSVRLYEDWSTARINEEPEFLAPIENLTIPIGREAILSCTVKNLGRYKVAWVRAEDQTILSLHTRVVTHNSRISVTHDNLRTWQLRIKQLKETDRGCYMCQINTSQMRIQKGCLDVYVPPDIINDDTSGDLSVSEGENATLWCKATGHPEPRIAWRKEDGQPILIRRPGKEVSRVETYNGSSLFFWKLDRKQMGAYLCIASNDVPPAVSKRIALNVNFAPLIKVPNQLLGAPLNTDVQLECYVEAFPNTINYWIKNRGEMLINGSKYTIREERSGYKVFMWLVIRSFSPSDIGTYNCVSTNSLGRVEGTLRLYEIKVGPEGLNDHISVVGGLAEPARGHRTRSSESTSCSSSTESFFTGVLSSFFVHRMLR